LKLSAVEAQVRESCFSTVFLRKRGSIGVYAGRIPESFWSGLAVSFTDGVVEEVQIEVSLGFEPRG